jgi:gas vesicle protein
MKRLLATLGSILVIGSTLAITPAQSADRDPNSDSSATAEATRDRSVESHINELHKELGITAAQQAQWDRVAQTMRENAKRLDKVIDQRKESMDHATAVDDLNAYAQVAQTHADNVKRMADAFSGLYSTMSDEQKREADKVFNHQNREARSARNARADEASATTTQHP